MSGEARQDFALAFLSILFEGMPFILLGTWISGMLDVYLPAGAMDRILPRRRLPALLVSGLLGAVFPVCECAVVPVIRRLVKKGLPVSCAFTYMLAAPVVNPVTALSTWKAFQGQHAGWMTCSRLLLGFFMAVAVGWIVSKLSHAAVLRPGLAASPGDSADRPHSMENGCCGHEHGSCRHEEAPKSAHEACRGDDHEVHGHGDCSHSHAAGGVDADARLVAACRSAMRDFVDVGVYFTLGVAITALFNTGIAPGASWLDGLASNRVAAPAALMALAFLLSLCSTSDAFIAATLDKFSWGAKLSFLVFGPMMDAKLVFLYQSVMRRRFILFLALGLFAGIGVAGLLIQRMVLPTQ